MASLTAYGIAQGYALSVLCDGLPAESTSRAVSVVTKRVDADGYIVWRTRGSGVNGYYHILPSDADGQTAPAETAASLVVSCGDSTFENIFMGSGAATELILGTYDDDAALIQNFSTNGFPGGVSALRYNETEGVVYAAVSVGNPGTFQVRKYLPDGTLVDVHYVFGGSGMAHSPDGQTVYGTIRAASRFTPPSLRTHDWGFTSYTDSTIPDLTGSQVRGIVALKGAKAGKLLILTVRENLFWAGAALYEYDIATGSAAAIADNFANVATGTMAKHLSPASCQDCFFGDGTQVYRLAPPEGSEFVAARCPGDGGDPTPPVLAGSRACPSGAVSLTWAPGDNNASWRVYRDGVDVSGEITETTFEDLATNPALSYVYTVRAYNAQGEPSELSVPVTALTCYTGTDWERTDVCDTDYERTDTCSTSWVRTDGC